MPDGTKKVFIGQSASSDRGTAHYAHKDCKAHYFTGPHWLEPSSKEEYDKFKPSAEESK
jgi:hypothetical protein